MRDIKRIDEILERLKNIWLANPDLRLGQMISNVFAEPIIYYIEDDKLIKHLEEYYLPCNIVYGKRKVGNEWIEDKEMIARKFGDTLKACFTCKKEFSCKAIKIEDCEFEQKENVALFKEI